MDLSLNENNTSSKRDYWLLHMKAWEESKLKQKAYCSQAGIRYSTFVYWRGILLDKKVKKEKATFLPIQVKPNKPIVAESAPRAIQIKLVSGHVVYIPANLDVDVIGKLIQCLGNSHAQTSTWHRNLFKCFCGGYEKID